MPSNQVLIVGLQSLLLTLLLVALSRRFAPALGLVDSPSAHKKHEGEIPIVGGLAILCTLLILLLTVARLREHWPFLVGALTLSGLGLVDDLTGMRAPIRLAVQSTVILLVGAFSGALIHDLGNIAPNGSLLALGWFAIPFTIFGGVGLINAFNMADGIDGLCGSLLLCTLSGLFIVSIAHGNTDMTLMIASLIGGVIAFLFFNLRVPGRTRALVFLGDTGTYLLGFSVLYVIIKLSQGPDRAMTPVTALWFCLLPLLDTVAVMLKRIRNGRSPFAADRAHLHHAFILSKFSVFSTLSSLTAVACAGVVFGLAGLYAGIPERWMMAAFLMVSAGYYVLTRHIWSTRRFLRRTIDQRAGKDRRQVNLPLSEIPGGIERRRHDRRGGDPGRDRRVSYS